MKLIRNTTSDGHCKYALVRMDKMPPPDPAIIAALQLLEKNGLLEFAGKNDPEECFVVKLKDTFTVGALIGYRQEVLNHVTKLLNQIGISPSLERYEKTSGWIEYASEIEELIQRSMKLAHRRPPN